MGYSAHQRRADSKSNPQKTQIGQQVIDLLRLAFTGKNYWRSLFAVIAVIFAWRIAGHFFP